ncbi:MAG: shikimate kinase [Phycisphaeraceae bacterium]
MDIVLIGYRGSGKTTIGRLLAERRCLRLIDTDKLVRDCFQGAEVSSIFATHGEPAFRKVETQIALELLQGTGFVAALGGGTPVQPAVTERLLTYTTGVILYLHAPAEVLAERIAADTTDGADRPSLTGRASAADEVAAVLAQREPTYRQLAHHTLDVSTQTPDEIVDGIEAILDGRK